MGTVMSPSHNAAQAYAAARMAESCLLGLQGKDNIYECAYVESSLIPELSYFASKVRASCMPVKELVLRSTLARTAAYNCAARQHRAKLVEKGEQRVRKLTNSQLDACC